MTFNFNIKISFSTLLTLFISIFSLGFLGSFAYAGEYQGTEVYGNGQTSCFRGAMTGSRGLTPEEEAYLATDLPIKENGHYYARVSANTGTLTLSNYQRRGRSNFLGNTAVVNRAQVNQIGLEVALGYFFDKDSRLELEYLVNRTLSFTATVPPSPNPGFNVRVSTNTFLFNGYYEFTFHGYDRFRPFIVLGIGPSFTSIRYNDLTGVSARRTRESVNFSAGGGIGFRFRVFTRWFVSLSFRYIYLGTTTVQPNPNLRFQGNYYYSPVSLGLIYIF